MKHQQKMCVDELYGPRTSCPPSTTLHVHNSLEDSTTSEESDDGNRASDLNSEEGADDDDDGGWSQSGGWADREAGDYDSDDMGKEGGHNESKEGDGKS